MALTTDQITLCNQALGYIGEFEVEAGKTAEKQYVLCERYLESTIKSVLAGHPWNEAKYRVWIPENKTAVRFGYDHIFTLPTDCVRVLRLNNGENDYDHWECERGSILTNIASRGRGYSDETDYFVGEYIEYEDVTYSVDTSFTATGEFTDDAEAYMTSLTEDYAVLLLEYIRYDSSDITTYSQPLTDAIAQQLAIRVATGLTNDPKTKVDLLNEFERLTLPRARSVDGQQGRVRPFFKSRWWRSRTGNWSY